MTTPSTSASSGEGREDPTARRAREAAERAEWSRLSAIYFAHQQAIAPGKFHCFCGSLDDMRRAVAEIQRAGNAPSSPPGRADASGARQRVATAGPAPNQDAQRRAQLNQWHDNDARDRAAADRVADGEGSDA